MDRLVAMSVFRKVIECGSFTVAAERLQMSNASASKYVAALERHIGLPLLARTTRRLQLTEAGRDYHARCVRILDDIDDAESSTGRLQTTPRGQLKVRAPVSLVAAHLGRTVADFMARFPEVTVELTLNDRFGDPAEEGFDVALLIAASTQAAPGAARPIARWARVLCAAPAYLERHGEPASVADLRRHNCLIYSRGQAPDEWRFSGPDGERSVRVSGNVRSNNAMVLREALLEGLGVGLLPAFLVAPEIDSGALRVPLAGWMPQARTLYAIYPQPRQQPPKVREFVNFLARSFAADSQWQMGGRVAPLPASVPAGSPTSALRRRSGDDAARPDISAA